MIYYLYFRVSFFFQFVYKSLNLRYIIFLIFFHFVLWNSDRRSLFLHTIYSRTCRSFRLICSRNIFF
nr:MAG TPA: hypothetical protein [Caudoviricetes sp.]